MACMVSVAPSRAMTVPYVSLGLRDDPLKAELMAAIDAVLDHGRFILGPEVEQFERTFAERWGVPHAIGVASGTDALLLSMRALGIGPGDEVITVPNSFVASTATIALSGATPVFVDVRDDLQIDPQRLAAALTPRTKAVLVVHLTGRPAEMETILAIAARRGLHVIEDCAQAIGARYRGRMVGTFGSAGCFSFHPLKNLNACGDGGMILTAKASLHAALAQARNHGLQGRDACAFWSYNSRLDTLQAALLSVKLRHLEEWNLQRRAMAATYCQQLRDVVTVPEERPHEYAVYQTFVIQAPERDALQQHLGAHGIETRVHYPTPLHLQPAAESLGYRRGDFPVAERLAQRILSLPIYPGLTSAQQDAVIQAIRSFYGR